MAHVGYFRWYAYIKEIIKQFYNKEKPSIFEIGCGTGSLGEYLEKDGYPYIASDISFQMCFEAKKKLGKTICADGRILPLKDSAYFDVILFLYDGINYLLTKEEYDKLFNETYSHLKPFGLFLFDITTLYNSKNNFNEYLDADDYGDYFYFRHSYFDSARSVQYNDFIIFKRKYFNNIIESDKEEDLYVKATEHHVQRIFPVDAIKNLIDKDKFDIVGIWDGFSFKKPNSRSERVHFLLRKKGKS
jgi:SAM-dependent methyltransferase